MKPNQPIYVLDSNPNVAYKKDQLQIIQPNEIMPDKKVIRSMARKKGKDMYIIEKIIDKKNIKIRYNI